VIKPSLSTPHGLEQENRLRTLGGDIRRARVALRLSQEKLAEAAGLYAGTIARIEAGRLNVRRETLARIETALGCQFQNQNVGPRPRFAAKTK
jgi:transcriptional regulator with XRE-family HTH domain